MGRFMRPDPSGLYYADPGNPQSFNLYSYGQNNPLTNIDPTGLDCVKDNGDGTATTNTGDCANENEAAANAEHYIDCDGCTSGATGAQLDTATGSLYLTTTDANGNTSGIAGTTISDWADPQGTSPTNVNVGGTSYDVSMSGYGFSGQLAYFPFAALPGLPSGQLRPGPPTGWAGFWMRASCWAGQEPDNLKPFGAEEEPHDADHPTKNMEGQRKLPGPNTDVKKKGTMPYNDPNGGEAAGAAAEGAAYFSNVGACLNNVNHP